MSKIKFSAVTHFLASRHDLFAFHQNPGAFQRLTPPWAPVKCLEHTGGIKDGARVLLEVEPLKLHWLMGHKDFVQDQQFVDYQVKGPFKSWHHEHLFTDAADNNGILEDRLEIDLPAGMIANRLMGPWLKGELKRLFDYRHAITARDMRLKARLGGAPLVVLVSGTNGLIGGALCALLSTQGHRVLRLVRADLDGNIDGATESQRADEDVEIIRWHPDSGTFFDHLPALDAVVHLAGRNIASKYWTEKEKSRLYQSRVVPTVKLALKLASMAPGDRPKVFFCASGISIYGDGKGKGPCGEDSPASDDFLGNLAVDWEAACKPAADAGIRVVNGRFGVVLSPKSGALGKMLPAFEAGLGGPIGDGEQLMPWISLDDAIAAIYQCIADREHEAILTGPVNIVSPQIVSNGEFAKTLAHVLHRPCAIAAPEAVLKIALGEMAESLVLSSVHALPKKLKEAAFDFRDADLEGAMRFCMGR